MANTAAPDRIRSIPAVSGSAGIPSHAATDGTLTDVDSPAKFFGQRNHLIRAAHVQERAFGRVRKLNHQAEDWWIWCGRGAAARCPWPAGPAGRGFLGPGAFAVVVDGVGELGEERGGEASTVHGSRRVRFFSGNPHHELLAELTRKR